MSISREYKVGVFVIGTAVIILLALLFLAVQKGFFQTSHTYTLSCRTGDGLAVGMPVVFSGFDIGRVHTLELDDKGAVLIKIRVPDKHAKWIRQDSFFVLYRPLIGAARIVVVPLQRLAYEVAVELGLDVDQPRNLAKSVTVE